MSEERWIKVESVTELAAGMTVRLAGCSCCCRPDRNHVFILSRPGPFEAHAHAGGLCMSPWWQTVDQPCPRSEYRGLCTGEAVPEGRLFRLDTGDLSKTGEERVDDIVAKHRAQGRVRERLR